MKIRKYNVFTWAIIFSGKTLQEIKKFEKNRFLKNLYKMSGK